MVQDVLHLGLGLQDHEDRVKKLPPKDVPEIGWKVATILFENIKKIVRGPRLGIRVTRTD